MRRIFSVGISILAFAASVLAQDAPRDRIEFGLSGGLGFPQAEPSSGYSRDYSQTPYSRIFFDNSIVGEAGSAVFLRGFFSFFFSRPLGIQVAFGYLGSNLDTRTDFDFSYTRTTTENLQRSWEGTGKLTAIPLSINLAARLGKGKLEGFLSAGPAVFFNSFEATSTAGLSFLIKYANNEWDIDALPLSLEIAKTSWTSFGADVGGGIGLNLVSFLSLFAEARYLYSPKREFTWDWLTGYSTGIRNVLVNVNVPSNAIGSAPENTSVFVIDPSFFQVSLGVKLRMGN